MNGKVLTIAAVLVAFAATSAVAQDQASPDRIEQVKQSFTASKQALRGYEWIETVALSLSGEEKVRQQYTCYYGAEGRLQKVPVAPDVKEEKKRGLRGKVADSKKAELQASLKSAIALLDQYTPLDPAKIQAAKAAGNVSVSVPGADGVVRVTIKSYHQPGDQVEVHIDGNQGVIKAVGVNSEIQGEKSKSPVAAKVTYGTLQDGTLYPASETLDMSAQGLKVDVTNSGYKKHAQ